MKYLKYFENSEIGWSVERDDIIETFNDFVDEFNVTVVFGKRLHQFDVVDVKIADQDIKLGFKYYAKVRLIPLDKKSPWQLSQYINSDYFIERQSEIVSKLDYHDLELTKVFVESTPSSILFLIYSK
jgi:hypothetical protein